ncbi:DUF1835 domain-containing protein [Mucilaginibacter gotjawali]|uniref:Uncharacterized protein n=2 Tax=Mucilaginibacter gotjawali TaxID=1550579 RepID=A0A839SLF2_9SPHI|nr:DUF1835 domain-containing protein [Mucilaginibacter gotjawali]MBB3058133.1 hypothetical protein [Mucilaginibacter gotjawali]BAU52108.1 hypothetical protein MgSA37_00258 [Mucilaginibacter gotjawali]
MSILHILNGDSTALGFEETGLEGDVLVWREVLSEGPLEENITSASFWKKRSEWICETFNDTPENYQQNVLDQLAKLDDSYDEINLWFEFDLHCQANLLGIMTYLKQKTDLSAPATYLICPNDYPGKDNFRGMGELNGEELVYLYDTIRMQLSEIDFVLAAEAWAAYTMRDAEKLQRFLNNTTFWGSLHLLKPALSAQLKRLVVNDKGLNYIEQKLLDIYNYGYKTWPEILSVFWEKEKIFGMGDMEINIYLQKLISKKLVVLN